MYAIKIIDSYWLDITLVVQSSTIVLFQMLWLPMYVMAGLILVNLRQCLRKAFLHPCIDMTVGMTEVLLAST